MLEPVLLQTLRTKLRPLRNFAFRRLDPLGLISSHAACSEILEPAERQPRAPLYVLEEEWDRIEQAGPYEDLDTELANLRADHLTHAPVIRHEIKHAVLHWGGIEGRFHTARHLGKTELKALVKAPVHEVDALAVASEPLSMRFFGHFLHDALPASLLKRPDEALALLYPETWWQADDYRKLFQIEPSVGGIIYAERLSFFEDQGQGPSKRARYQELRQRLRHSLGGAPGPNAGRCIYLRRPTRGTSERRRIQNEAALTARLERAGFVILDSTELDARSLATQLLDAKCLCSPEGSPLAHGLYALQPGALLLPLILSDRFVSIFLDLAPAAGLKRGFVIAQKQAGGYAVDAETILRTLDLAKI